MKKKKELCDNKPKLNYWSKRSNMMHYQYVDYPIRALATEAKSLIDVGSSEAQYIEIFHQIPKRNTLDINKPYDSENVEGKEMTEHLEASYRELTPTRRGERNGCYTRNLVTPAGKIERLGTLE